MKSKMTIFNASWTPDWTNVTETLAVPGKIGLCALVIVRV
jgi:hypothetical protein